MFLSVIIPVYNVESYLKDCINSILYQKLNDIEIILINDGSTDNSGKICDFFSEKHDNIKVIHQSNDGLSSARNIGINFSQGDFIMFLDSDDWWNGNVDMKAILKKIKNDETTEMFLLSSLDYIEGKGFFRRKEHYRLDNIRTDSVNNYYNDLLSNGNLEVHAGTKIFKRCFLLNNNLYFKRGLVGEDNEWMIRVLRVLKKVKIINQPIYIYRNGRQESITNNIKEKNILDLLSIIKDSINYFKKVNDEDLKKLELNFCSYLWFVSLGLCAQIENGLIDKLQPIFRETECVNNYNNSIKSKICYKLYKLCYFNFIVYVLGIYIEKKNKFKFKKEKN